MIVEVNDAGDIVVPAELVQAHPDTRLEADRVGDSLVLRPVAEKLSRKAQFVSSLLALEGRLANPQMTFRRDEMYGPDGR